MENQMPSAALRTTPDHRHQAWPVVGVRLPLADAPLLLALACRMFPLGTQITSTAAAGDGELRRAGPPRHLPALFRVARCYVAGSAVSTIDRPLAVIRPPGTQRTVHT
jgi:hypothetical protein